MKNTPLILMATAALYACSQKTYQQPPNEPTNTTIITETIHDTTIVLQPDTATIIALIRCDSTGQAYLEQLQELQANTNIHQQLQIENNRLSATAKIDPMAIYLTWKQRDTATTIIKPIEIQIPVETNILHPWQKALMLIGAATLTAIALLLIAKKLPR